MTYDTKREEALLSLLRKSGEQGLTLQDICERLTPDGKGKSTIFRLLAALTERGEIRKLPSGQGRRFIYQYTGSEACHRHLHLKCVGCGRFIHLTDKLSALLCDALSREGHFTLDGERSLLFGRCECCRGGERV
ncbi:MAG: transcriptional repressor [Clostridia bacterium]|nr:transcriptional repressor [Clostridia bacterium]